jgi:hypothetical protein
VLDGVTRGELLPCRLVSRGIEFHDGGVRRNLRCVPERIVPERIVVDEEFRGE